MKRTTAFLGEMIFLTAVLVSGVEDARAEGFVDFAIGGAFASDTSQKIEAMGISGTGSGEFEETFLIGGRIGYWFNSVPWLGFALDVSHFKTEESTDKPSEVPSFKLEVIPISPLLMLRYPLLKSAEFPRGEVYPYLGVGPGMYVSITEVRLIDLGLPGDFKSTNFEVGADLRVGIKLFYPTDWCSLFTEYRFNYAGPTRSTGFIGVEPAVGKLGPMTVHSFAFGIGFHF
jgi:hypothetical protein